MPAERNDNCSVLFTALFPCVLKLSNREDADHRMTGYRGCDLFLSRKRSLSGSTAWTFQHAPNHLVRRARCRRLRSEACFGKSHDAAPTRCTQPGRASRWRSTTRSCSRILLLIVCKRKIVRVGTHTKSCLRWRDLRSGKRLDEMFLSDHWLLCPRTRRCKRRCYYKQQTKEAQIHTTCLLL